jgi:hypothetical protein
MFVSIGRAGAFGHSPGHADVVLLISQISNDRATSGKIH